MALTEAELRELTQLKAQSASLQQRFQPEAPIGTSQTKALEGTEGLPLETATDPRQAIGRALETIPELGGMLTGGAKAAQLLGPRGKVLGGLARIGGSALGAGLGEEVEIAGKQAVGLDAPSTFEENIKAFGKAAGTGAIAETLGLGIGLSAAPVRKLIFEPLKKTAIKGASEINKGLQKYGSNLLNSQATTSTFLDMLQNIYQTSFVTAGQAAKVREGQALAGKQMVDDFTNAFLKRADPEDVGDMFASSVVAKENLNREVADTLYSGVDALTSNQARVNLAGLEASLKGSRSAKLALKNAAKELELSDLSNLSFQEAANLKTAISKKFFALTKGATSTAKGKVAQTAKDIDTAMDVAATKFDFQRQVPGDTTAKQLKEARKAWTDLNETFHNKFINSLMEADPITIGKKLTQIKEIGQVKQLKAAVDKDTFQKIKGRYVQGILGKAERLTEVVDPKSTVEVVGKQLKTALSPRNTSRRVLNEMLGGPAVAKLNKIADTLSLLEAKGTTSAMGVATQLIQVGALSSLGAGIATGNVGAVATGAGLLLSPVGIGKLLSSETGRKIILDGLKAEPTRAEAARLVGRITSFLGADAVISQEGLASGEPVKEERAEEVPFVQKRPRNNILQQLGQLKGLAK